jgi:hypothetical protein
VHGHCHDKSIPGFKTEIQLLKRIGVPAEAPESGCCGMAGSFGFEPGDKYEVSMNCGEQVLLPAVRGADQHTLILADGFSCRTQIEQATSRRALHLARAIQLALAEDTRRAEGRSRVAVAMPLHQGVAAKAQTIRMISGDEDQEQHNRHLGSLTITAGSLAGGLLLAYVGGRYLGLPAIMRLSGIGGPGRKGSFFSDATVGLLLSTSMSTAPSRPSIECSAGST